MSDSISDMLTSLRNAIAVNHPTVDVPYSNLKYEIAKILTKEGFIEKAEKKGKKNKKVIEITLRYNEEKKPVISGLKRISKPGQKIYSDSQRIKKTGGGYGLIIVSTSKGLMTDREAKKQKLGGELLCRIW